MKKFLTTIIILGVFVAVYYGVISKENQEIKNKEDEIISQIEENPSLYPLYNRIDDKEKNAYIKVVSAVKNFDKGVGNVYVGESEAEINEFIETFSNYVYREIAYEHPEMFWFDPYNYETVIYSNSKDKYVLNINLVYLFDKEEAEKMNVEFQQKIDEIVSIAKTKTNTYDQILFVHDYILDNCVYDYETVDADNFKSPSINAYGCLVDGKAICSGYAMAFNTIMKRLGYEIGVEFNDYSGLSIMEDGHVWNYCMLDGEYYYFDLTWDDIDSQSGDLHNCTEYYHSYFGITKDELEDAHLLLADEAPTPDCNGTKYNYFIYNNINFNKYDFESVKSAILSQSDKKLIELRFDSYTELLAAERDLITDGKIWTIFPDMGDCHYNISDSDLQLYILLSDEL